MGGWGGGGSDHVQGFQLKSRDFCQPVQGSPLSRLASMHYIIIIGGGLGALTVVLVLTLVGVVLGWVWHVTGINAIRGGKITFMLI